MYDIILTINLIQRKVYVMKKKILSLLAAISVLASSSAVFADTIAENEVTADEAVVTSEVDEAVVTSENAESEKQVKVFIDDTLILFSDQQPVIKDDFTLVPARGVFEAMNNKVSWDGDKRMVTINSANNITRIVLTIDNNTMSVYTFTNIMNADLTEVALEVAPQIINDRTMIPLRAISEALGTTVNWDGDKYEVHIVTETEDDAPADSEKAEKLELSLTADKTEVKEGEEVTLSMNAKNISLYPNNFVSAVTAAVSYDKNNFEFVDAYMTDAEGNKVAGDTGANNPDYTADSLKTVHVTINSDSAMKADGTLLKLIFKAKNTAESNFALVDRYNTRLGNDVTILLTTMEEDYTNTMLEGKNIVIDTTPVTVNAAEKTDDKTDAEVKDESKDESADNTEADTEVKDDVQADADTVADDTVDTIETEPEK